VSQIPGEEDMCLCGVATGAIILAAAVAGHLGAVAHVGYPRPAGDDVPFCYTRLSHAVPLLLIEDATGIGLTKLRLVEALVVSGHQVRLLSLQTQGRDLVRRYAALRVAHRYSSTERYPPP
jgi:orotate phosphoribosyltransferase